MPRKKRKIFPEAAAADIGQAGKRYYPGTNVRTTDPFYVMRCRSCGRTCWSIFKQPMPCSCGEIMTIEKTDT